MLCLRKNGKFLFKIFLNSGVPMQYLESLHAVCTKSEVNLELLRCIKQFIDTFPFWLEEKSIAKFQTFTTKYDEDDNALKQLIKELQSQKCESFIEKRTALYTQISSTQKNLIEFIKAFLVRMKKELMKTCSLH